MVSNIYIDQSQFNISHLFAHIIYSILPSYYQSGSEWTRGHSNEVELHIPQSSNARALTSGCLMSYWGYSWARALPLCRDAVGVIYNPGRLCYNFYLIYVVLAWLNELMVCQLVSVFLIPASLWIIFLVPSYLYLCVVVS